MIRRILALFRRKPRIVRIGRSIPGDDMSPEQMREALGIPQDTPLWQLIHQLLDEHRTQYMDALTDPTTAGETGKMDRLAGSYAALDAIQTWLIDEHRKVIAGVKA